MFSSKWPPQEESKCKNVQFLHGILKDDDVYFKKKKFFNSEKYRFFTQNPAATILRHWATMG